MPIDAYINAAIEAGQSHGVASLDPAQRLVFLISEAEVLCDMEGIDSFLDHYSPAWLPECAAAFQEVGASEIADGIRTIAAEAPPSEPTLDRINELITRRIGYDYSAIRAAVEARLTALRSGSGPL